MSERSCRRWVDAVSQVGVGGRGYSGGFHCPSKSGSKTMLRLRVWWGRGWRSEEQARYDVVIQKITGQQGPI